MRAATLALLFAFTVVPSGCAAEAIAPGSAAPDSVDPTSLPAAGDARLVVGRVGESGLQVLLASTGAVVDTWPLGAPDEAWRRVVTVTRDGRVTRVEDRAIDQPLEGGVQSIEGAWRLPVVGLDPLPVGVSADGSTIVLVEDLPATKWAIATASRFAVVSRGGARATRIIELGGSFEFDALSPDGSRLYVAQHVPGPLQDRYQVRVVSTATGVMDEAIIVDKRNLDEAMAGRPISQFRRADGMVFTLYRGAEYPFIHALDTVDAWAVCIDLPAEGMDDTSAGQDWGVAGAGGEAPAMAINATLGIAVEIDPAELTIRRTMDIGAPAVVHATLAKTGQDAVTVGRRVVVAPDGQAIFAAGREGIRRIDAKSLTLLGRSLTGQAVDAISISHDGSGVFALVHDGGRIAGIDPVSGEVRGWVEGAGFDRLVAALPVAP